MRTILVILSLALISCAGSAKMNADGSVVVNGPFMARADRMAVNVKRANGDSLKFMMVNGNSEKVPIEAFRSAAALGLGLGQLSVTKADNASKAVTTQQSNAASAALAAQKQADATALEMLKLTPAP